jgi:hypothetical protein
MAKRDANDSGLPAAGESDTTTLTARPETETPATVAQPLCVVPLGRGTRGKTWWVRWALDRALAKGREVVIADADRTNATLSAFFAGVVSPPSADEADMRDWFAAFVERQITDRFNAVIDLGGGDLILKQLAREIGLTGFLERYAIRPVAVHLIGPDRDDLAYLRDLEQDGLFAPTATILVLNEALVPRNRSEKAAFQSTILDHPAFLAALDRGAKVVWMPRLAAAHEVDSRRLTFTAAEDNQVKSGQPSIGPWNRQLIHNWLRDMEGNFAPVAHWLP